MKIEKIIKKQLADTLTPVSIYLNIRKHFKDSILLEGADFHNEKDSFSFICFDSISFFKVENNKITIKKDNIKTFDITEKTSVPDELYNYIKSFKVSGDSCFSKVDGIFGYSSYNAEKYFENIDIAKVQNKEYNIPEIQYHLYKYIISINHLTNEMFIQENLLDGVKSDIVNIEYLLKNINNYSPDFNTVDSEVSNVTDDEYKQMVTKGKMHCKKGDVFQIVLSRQFSQKFEGDEFKVYRALRSINPSPYLFYFDYGDYKIMGSSPEAQIKVIDNVAVINPIAGTYKRTGDYDEDLQSAEDLKKDTKENAEHIMLVDLARNDLSRKCSNVKVEVFKKIQFFSHVIHLVSRVTGITEKNSNTIQLLAETFPAGTLSGAPKYKAMQLIDKYENQDRGFYGGGIGFLAFNGDINHAIMIRSFLSKNSKLYYQAGAGVVISSDEESELAEVNNKLAALKKALELAETIKN